MTEIEKMKRYIGKYGAPRNRYYDASMKEMFALAREMDVIEAINMAFIYGKAKGYRAAKAERRAAV